jgi:hypothetical protein
MQPVALAPWHCCCWLLLLTCRCLAAQKPRQQQAGHKSNAESHHQVIQWNARPAKLHEDQQRVAVDRFGWSPVAARWYNKHTAAQMHQQQGSSKSD